MPAAKQLDRKTAVKRIISTLDRLPSDGDRAAVLDVTITLNAMDVPHATRGETDGSVPHVSRRA